jgi:hypothetical protein
VLAADSYRPSECAESFPFRSGPRSNGDELGGPRDLEVGSVIGSNLATKNTDETEVSDTESVNLVLVRDQEVDGSNPFAPTTIVHTCSTRALFALLTRNFECSIDALP